MSPVKEPNFFAIEGKQFDYRGPGDDGLEWINEREVYLQLFQGVRFETALGEASPLYLYATEAPERIRRYIPDVTLIALLRNPVERAYSAFSYLRERGRERCSSFTDALEAEDARIAQNWSHIWHYRAMGFYGEQLARYFQLFDRDQIRVFLYEDFVAEPLSIVRDVFDHIGVDSTFIPDTRLRHNISGVPRFRALDPVLKPNRVTLKLRPAVSRVLNPVILRVKQRALVKSEIPPEAGRHLAAAYRGDVERLAEIIGRDLSAWLSAYE
jgi:hypothetical protein